MNYAENLVIRDCMKEQGHTWLVDPLPDDYLPPTLNQNMRKLFNVSLAKRFGYHGAPSPLDAGPATEQRESPAAERARRACMETDMREQVPENTWNGFASSLAGAAYDGAKANQKVHDAITRWHDCMQPFGISDLPDEPYAMPGPTLRAKYFKDPGPDGTGFEETEPTPAEIKVATADATCQEESGFLHALYQAEWDRQLDLVATNEDELARVAADTARLTKTVDDIIDRYHG